MAALKELEEAQQKTEEANTKLMAQAEQMKELLMKNKQLRFAVEEAEENAPIRG